MCGNVIFWRPLHYFASTVALVLVGVHIGLHWSFIRTSFSRVLRVPRLIARPLGIVALTVVLAFGVYSIATSHLLHWLGEPFTAADDGPDGVGKGQGGQGKGLHLGGGGAGEAEHPLVVIATHGSIVAVPAALTAATEVALKRRKLQPKLSVQLA